MPSTSSSSTGQHQESFQAVWRLYCKHCNMLWSSRGMEAMVMARPAIRCFSTDLPPLGCDVVHPPLSTPLSSLISDSQNGTYCGLAHHARRFDLALTGPCDCHVQDVACLGCGNIVGYYIHRPCFRCLAQRLRIKQRGFQHLWTFYQENVAVVQREDDKGIPIGWNQLPSPSFSGSATFRQGQQQQQQQQLPPPPPPPSQSIANSSLLTYQRSSGAISAGESNSTNNHIFEPRAIVTSSSLSPVHPQHVRSQNPLSVTPRELSSVRVSRGVRPVSRDHTSSSDGGRSTSRATSTTLPSVFETSSDSDADEPGSGANLRADGRIEYQEVEGGLIDARAAQEDIAMDIVNETPDSSSRRQQQHMAPLGVSERSVSRSSENDFHAPRESNNSTRGYLRIRSRSNLLPVSHRALLARGRGESVNSYLASASSSNSTGGGSISSNGSGDSSSDNDHDASVHPAVDDENAMVIDTSASTDLGYHQTPSITTAPTAMPSRQRRQEGRPLTSLQIYTALANGSSHGTSSPTEQMSDSASGSSRHLGQGEIPSVPVTPVTASDSHQLSATLAMGVHRAVQTTPSTSPSPSPGLTMNVRYRQRTIEQSLTSANTSAAPPSLPAMSSFNVIPTIRHASNRNDGQGAIVFEKQKPVATPPGLSRWLLQSGIESMAHWEMLTVAR